jgi:hypothetical protein
MGLEDLMIPWLRKRAWFLAAVVIGLLIYRWLA